MGGVRAGLRVRVGKVDNLTIVWLARPLHIKREGLPSQTRSTIDSIIMSYIPVEYEMKSGRNHFDSLELWTDTPTIVVYTELRSLRHIKQDQYGSFSEQLSCHVLIHLANFHRGFVDSSMVNAAQCIDSMEMVATILWRESNRK